MSCCNKSDCSEQPVNQSLRHNTVFLSQILGNRQALAAFCASGASKPVSTATQELTSSLQLIENEVNQLNVTHNVSVRERGHFMRGLNDEIICEDFAMTDSIRDAVQEKIQFIEDHTKKRFPVKVYISKEGDSEYQVRFQAHVSKKDLEATGRGDDFYAALKDGKGKFLKLINDQKSKELTKRHRQAKGT